MSLYNLISLQIFLYTFLDATHPIKILYQKRAVYICPKPTIMQIKAACIFIVATLSFFSVPVFSQSKTLQAVNLQQAPKLDGKLDDAVWQNIPEATNFIINQPEFGKPASQKTTVKIIYTDDALYIGAYMYDDPKLVRTQLTSRDVFQFQDVDNFGVSIDTYNDKQNAFQFVITAVNVQNDIRISAANNGGGGNFEQPGFDKNWDAVWDSKTSFASDGWMAEIKIPYSAIRFSKEEIQHWGINFSRFVRRTNEQSFWNPVNPNMDGFVNQFGQLENVKGIKPPLRLSFLPYISTGYSTVPTNAGTINTFLHNGGMDVKYGVNESYTLDMTLVPDFGQVQSDNVVLNLSPFEQKFNENRPFFTEGTELFNKAGIFYSRRIGSTPGGYYDALQLAADSGFTVVKNPSLTQLYNATKFSGRSKNNLGIGVFNAVTAPMYATLQKPDGSKEKIQTEPLANYNIIVLDQAFKNRGYLTFTNTNVIRSGHARDANVSAIDYSVFDKKNTYKFSAVGKYSAVQGTDPHSGFSTNLSFEKVSGKWQWGYFNLIESEKYDPNDLGFLHSPNEFTNVASISYNQFTPDKHFNFRNYNIQVVHTATVVPFRYNDWHINGNFLHVFKNFWDITLNVESHPSWANDYFELRTPGLFVKKVPFTFLALFGSSDSRKKLFVDYGFGFADFSPIKNDPFYLINFGLRYRFNPKFSVEIGEEKQDDKGNIGFADFDSTGSPFIGLRRILQNTTTLNAIYNFKPRMNLSFRARHYWSRVTYLKFYNVKTDGNYLDIPFIDGYDENFNLFNIDMFYTWDFKPGSRLIIAWKNALGPDASIDGTVRTKYTSNLGQIFNVPHSNEFTVKFVYYLDYLQLKKKS